MALFEITLVLLFTATLAVAFSNTIRLPVELILLIASLVIACLPGIPPVHLNPDVVFFILLPPILSTAAYFTTWSEFKQNWSLISLLAFGLVVFTVLTVGYTVHWIAPEIPLPVAFLLGAVVSPPDASAATAIARQVGLPRRLITIIEGESLINDATALVSFRFTIAAIASGTFVAANAVGQFFVLAAGGCVVGLAVAYVWLHLLKLLKNSTAEALLSLLSCFFSYLIAEELHFSGVISTVATGLYFGRYFPQLTTAETRFEARGLWNALLLGINGIVFALIGLQLPSVIEALSAYPLSELSLLLFATIAILVVSRFVWIFSSAYGLHWLAAKFRAGNQPLPNWKELFILSWAGMRGIVSLAAALAIPLTMDNGTPFPGRDLIVFLTYGVIIVTLVVPSMTLPWLVRRFKLSVQEENHHEETSEIRLKMAEAALQRIDLILSDDGNNHAAILVREKYQKLQKRLKPDSEKTAYTQSDSSETHLRQVASQAVSAEKELILALRKNGSIHDELFHTLARELDVEEMRIKKNLRPL